MLEALKSEMRPAEMGPMDRRNENGPGGVHRGRLLLSASLPARRDQGRKHRVDS
jgi:hypothetical protein